MRLRMIVLAPLVTLLPIIAAEAQTPLPPDSNPVTLSGLPPINPADLDAEGRNSWQPGRTSTPHPDPGTSPTPVRKWPRDSVLSVAHLSCRAATRSALASGRINWS